MAYQYNDDSLLVDVREEEQAIYCDLPASVDREDVGLRYDRGEELVVSYQDGRSVERRRVALPDADAFLEPEQAVFNNGVLSIYFTEDGYQE